MCLTTALFVCSTRAMSNTCEDGSPLQLWLSSATSLVRMLFTTLGSMIAHRSIWTPSYVPHRNSYSMFVSRIFWCSKVGWPSLWNVYAQRLCAVHSNLWVSTDLVWATSCATSFPQDSGNVYITPYFHKAVKELVKKARHFIVTE